MLEFLVTVVLAGLVAVLLPVGLVLGLVVAGRLRERRRLRLARAGSPPAVRVDHRRARLPAPTPGLIEAMARAGCEAYWVATWGEKDAAKLLFDTSPDARADWEAVARKMYAQVALAGGARTQPIAGAAGA